VIITPGEYLLDPSLAVTRAGLVEELARLLGGWKIDQWIAVIAVDHPVTTPFPRTLQVMESAPWNERDFARRLRGLGIGAVDIGRRGLAGDVETMHRRLKLSGPGRATLVNHPRRQPSLGPDLRRRLGASRRECPQELLRRYAHRRCRRRRSFPGRAPRSAR
jgi:THUMP domain-like